MIKDQKNLSNDKVGLMEVFRYVVNKYKKQKIFFDEIWFFIDMFTINFKI